MIVWFRHLLRAAVLVMAAIISNAAALPLRIMMATPVAIEILRMSFNRTQAGIVNYLSA